MKTSMIEAPPLSFDSTCHRHEYSWGRSLIRPDICPVPLFSCYKSENHD